MTRKRKNPVVYLATAPNEAIAYMWADILSQQGIYSVVKAEGLRSAQYVFVQNMECEIHVLASKQKKAREILKPLIEAVETTEKEEASKPYHMSRNMLLYVILWAFNCGWIWLFSVLIYPLYKIIRKKLHKKSDIQEQ